MTLDPGGGQDVGPPRSGGLANGGAQLRRLLQGEELVLAPGAFDPFTALIIENLGFGAVYLGGNAQGIHLGVGQPLVTMTEAVDCARRASAAVRCPVIVDAGAGFGDAAHTHRTVREFERSGAAAIHIDDQPAPKRAHYHLGKGRVVPTADIVDKMGVALNARTDPDFVVIAKTDALRIDSLDETLRRCERIVQTGPDALLVVDLPPNQAPRVRREFPHLPLVWIGGHRGPVPSVQELQDGGFQLAVYPFTSLAAVAQALTEVWGAVKEHGGPGHDEQTLAQMRAYVLDLVGMKTYWDIEKETTEHDRDRR